MAFTAEELMSMRSSAVDMLHQWGPPSINPQFQRAWVALSPEQQKQVLRADQFFQEFGKPFFIKYEAGREFKSRTPVYWYPEQFLTIAQMQSDEFCDLWRKMDETQKSLVFFLRVVDLIKDAARWRMTRYVKKLERRIKVRGLPT